ncbi:hypothetical protein [Desulfoluna limicola]|nr:hypothetical protein [Desulfoluna limicola]
MVFVITSTALAGVILAINAQPHNRGLQRRKRCKGKRCIHLF